MKQHALFKVYVVVSFSYFVSGLEHEKSFLVQDSFGSVACLAAYNDSVYIANSNDVVQRDAETGDVQRTFRAHQNSIVSFIITEDSRMITSAYDDLIIIWNLHTGSILKRIFVGVSNTQIQSISYQNGKIIMGGADRKVRQLDLVTGRVLRTFDLNEFIMKVLAQDDHVFVAKTMAPFVIKMSILDGRPLMFYTGHSESSASIHLYENILFSGSVDSSILSWDESSGVLIRSYQAHFGLLYVVVVYDGLLYSAGLDRRVIQWNIETGQIIKTFSSSSFTQAIMSLAYLPQTLFSGSADATVVKWNTTTGDALISYKRNFRKQIVVGAWRNLVFSGGEDVTIRIWDSSIDSLDSFSVLSTETEFVFVLHVYKDFLFSGGPSNLLRHWDLVELELIAKLESPTLGFSAIDSDQSFVYAGGPRAVIYRWNISSGALTKSYVGHAAAIQSVIIKPESMYSGSMDSTMRIWNIESGEAVRTFNSFYVVYDVLLSEDLLIACALSSIEAFSLTSGQKTIFLEETFACTCIVSNGNRAFTAQSDASIRVRDLFTLSILETYLGHLDSVISLCFDDSYNLYSTGFDGSIKKWNMVTRRVAFSFEDRNNSVTSLYANENHLYVGLRKGSIVQYKVDDGYFMQAAKIHTGGVSLLLADDDFIYSSGIDGLIIRHSAIEIQNHTIMYNADGKNLWGLAFTKFLIISIEEDTKILILPKNNTSLVRKTDVQIPLFCITATDSDLIAGSRSGGIYAWDIETLKLSFELKGHYSQVNSLLLVENMLFSASSDKSIIMWSLQDKNAIYVFQRRSATALGHLGRVNDVTFCSSTLFSAGADLSVRRWNVQSGRHEGVYFGFSKAVTTVLCYNSSLFGGSEDFSVLLFSPSLPQQTVSSISSSRSSRSASTERRRIVVKGAPLENSRAINGQILPYAVISVIVVLLVGISVFLLYRRAKVKSFSPYSLTTTSMTVSQTFTDLETVVNSVLAISKHAAYLWESSAVAKIKKLATGGGGELFLAKLMDSNLRRRYGDQVVQKITFVKSKLTEDAFYQEVGIMIMLNSFPRFCKILGYTENPLSMILKYYSDGSLHEWLMKNRYSSAILLKITKEVSEALQTMHSYYLAHCDLKPQNVLVQVENGIPSCFLTDFGIAQILSDTIIAAKAFNIISLRGL